MNTIDLNNLLSEISSNPPCGDDLSYDPAFFEFENAIKGTPEIQFGKTITQKAQEPNWPQVQEMAVDLFHRSHDLRLAVAIVQALVHTVGWPGFRDGLKLVDGMIDRYWKHLNPLLDAEDHHDPTERLNILESLCDWQTTIGPLIRLPICTSPTEGSITLRDVHLTTGKLKAIDEETQVHTPEVIEAAFQQSDLAVLMDLQATVDDCRKVIERMASSLAANIKRFSNNNRPTSYQIDFSPMLDLLYELHRLLVRQTEKHPAFSAADVSPDPQNGIPDAIEGESPPQAGIMKMDHTMHPINTRKDVVHTLNQICAYYEKNEPTSPVPFLLKRAMGLVEKDFYEIMKDLAPDSLKQIQLIGGIAKESS